MAFPPPKYDLLALDLDGTLLDSGGILRPVTIDAVRRAQAAGIEPVICTGRGWAESKGLLDDLKGPGTAIIADGSLTVEYPSGRILRRCVLAHSAVRRIIAFLQNWDPELAILLLKDRWATGYDYLVVGNGRLDPASEWWFSHLPVRVRSIPSADDDRNPDDTLGVRVICRCNNIAALAAAMKAQLGSEAQVLHFPVPGGPLDNQRSPESRVFVDLLQVFAQGADKWTALRHLAESRGIPLSRIAAIGDADNDRAMIRNAALGIAMGNAVPSIKAASDRQTKSNAEDGVAFAVRRILTGDW